jgi:hypothetical protein
MEEFDWTPEFFSIFTIEPEDAEAPEGRLVTRSLADCEGFPDAEESFLDFVDFQIRALMKKKPDTAASSACKVYHFTETDGGEEDRKLLEEQLLMATDRGTFREGAMAFLDRLMGIPGVKPGLLVVARVSATLEMAAAGVKLLTVLWADFEDASRFLAEGSLALEEISQVLLRKLSRGFLYPYLGEDTPRHDLLKMNCRPVTHPFVGLLNVEPPPTTDQLLQKEVARAMFSREPGAEERYRGYFEKSPPKKRELFGEERLVKVGDLLPAREAAAVARESARTSHDLYSKEQKMKINVDGLVTVDLKLENLGESFFFAKEGGEKYLVIRGKSFQTNKSQLNSIDFLDVGSLSEAIERMKE